MPRPCDWPFLDPAARPASDVTRLDRGEEKKVDLQLYTVEYQRVPACSTMQSSVLLLGILVASISAVPLDQQPLIVDSSREAQTSADLLTGATKHNLHGRFLHITGKQHLSGRPHDCANCLVLQTSIPTDTTTPAPRSARSQDHVIVARGPRGTLARKAPNAIPRSSS